MKSAIKSGYVAIETTNPDLIADFDRWWSVLGFWAQVT